jgi:hypothetical protein
MLIVSGIILILMLLMIVMYFGDKYNWLSMRVNCVSSKCKWTKTPFLVNAIDLQGSKVLVQLEQAESTKGKNVIIGEERPRSCEDRIWSREVVLEKAADGKDVLKITVKASALGGQAGNLKEDQSSVQ